MKTRILSVLAALVLLLTSASPVSATHLGSEDNPGFTGYFYSSAIGDGNLTICFEGGTTVYDNRSTLSLAAQEWGHHIGLSLTSTGGCESEGSDPTNVRVMQGMPLGLSGCGGVFDELGSGYSKITIFLQDNGSCPYYWGTSGFPGPGLTSAFTVMFHEYGHALGLDHEQDNGSNGHNDLMDSGTYCNGAFIRDGSEYDIRSIRARYPALSAVGGSGGLNASCQAP